MKPYGSRSSVSWMYSIKKLWPLSYEALWEQVKCELNVQYKEALWEQVKCELNVQYKETVTLSYEALWEQVKCELNVQYKETHHWAMKPYGSRSSVSWMYSIKKLTTELWSLMGAGQVWVECTV